MKIGKWECVGADLQRQIQVGVGSPAFPCLLIHFPSVYINMQYYLYECTHPASSLLPPHQSPVTTPNNARASGGGECGPPPTGGGATTPYSSLTIRTHSIISSKINVP